MTSPAIKTFSRRAMLLAPVLLALAACSTGGPLMNASSSKSKAVTPASETVGTGKNLVGLLAADDPANLSDGASGSAYLAARLATNALAGAPVTLMVRRFESRPAALQKVAGEMAQAGVRLVVVSGDESAARELATTLAPRGVTVASVGQAGDVANRLFGAYARKDETAFSAAEMKRRGYGTIAIVRTGDAASVAYANGLAEAAAKVGLKVQFVDGSSATNAAAQLQSQAAMGFEPKALAFATGPSRAVEIVTALKSVPELAAVPVVGNGGWAVGAPSGLGKGWYPSLSRTGLAGFAEKFADAYGTRPTIEAAITYDLVVLGGVLPQVAAEDPFGPTTMTNAQGFTGVTGSFKFDSSGVARRPFAVVELK